MPDWTNYFSDYTAGTSTSDGWINISVPPVPLTAVQLQQDYEEGRQRHEEYQRECERQDYIYELQMQMLEQEMEEERQLIEDKKKYPLFFLKDGIV